MQDKLNFFYKSYNPRSLRTFYMRFDEDDSNWTEQQKIDNENAFQLANDKTICWQKISNFILNPDQNQFAEIIKRIQNKDLTVMTDNIRKSREVFTRIFHKNRLSSRFHCLN